MKNPRKRFRFWSVYSDIPHHYQESNDLNNSWVMIEKPIVDSLAYAGGWSNIPMPTWPQNVVYKTFVQKDPYPPLSIYIFIPISSKVTSTRLNDHLTHFISNKFTRKIPVHHYRIDCRHLLPAPLPMAITEQTVAKLIFSLGIFVYLTEVPE